MRKVLIVYKFLPEYRVDFYQHLKKKLLENDIELHLIYGKYGKIDALRGNEVQIEWAHYIPNRRLSLGRSETIWQPCLKHLKGKDLVIVQQENRLLLNYYLMLARHFSKFRLGIWGHVINMQNDPQSRGNRFRLFFIGKCDWWFGYTRSAKDFLVRNNFPENRITVVQNAIDTHALKKCYAEITNAEADELKKQLGITGNNVGIYCGAMYPDKDIDFILETCHLVRKEIPDFHMLFVGTGIEAAKVKKATECADWIHYIGPKYGRDRVIYFRISAIQIMPRLVGLCILDSFAMETPLITTEHPFHGPEIDYLENGINGIMTKDDIIEYSKVIVELFVTRKFMELIEKGKLASEKYTVENMAENFKNGILSCLNL
jgi:L-malate glycosyltransferase